MSQTATATQINEEKMHNFLGKVIEDFGASLSSILAYMGIKLGLYDTLAKIGSATPGELAERSGTNERYVREWLINQASGGYIEYEPESGKYSLSPEQKTALTDETSPFYVGGGFYVVKAMMNAQPRILDAFKNGGGMFWGEHDPDLFIGTERFFRPGYQSHLVSEWIPALNGIEEKLEAGGKVADVGCGHGASTIIMARAFPNSEFHGFDNHEVSIEIARARAREAGLADRVKFTVSSADDIPLEKFTLITFFDCLHDMGYPEGAARRAFEVLDEEGSVLLVEPMAGRVVEENFNPIGRTYSAASTLCCTANGMAHGGLALGAVATDYALEATMRKGGFKRFERVAETPFNRIFEIRKT